MEASPADELEAVRPRIRLLQAAFWLLVGAPIAIVGTYVASNMHETHTIATDLAQTQAAIDNYRRALAILERYDFTREPTSTDAGRTELDRRLASLQSSLKLVGLEEDTLAEQVDLFDRSAQLVGRTMRNSEDPSDLRRRLALQLAWNLSLQSKLRGASEPRAVDTSRMNPRVRIDFAPGSSTLDAEGIEKIATVAAEVADARARAIVVSGNADTVGSDELNYALAEKRAEAVQHELAARMTEAVPIEIDAHGERHLDVKTLDGISSAANRRAAIYLID